VAKKLLIFLFLFVAAERFCRWQTEGFTVAKISSTLEADPRYAAMPPGSEALAALDQPFHFLGSGAQFYAFESQDGKTVVKFIKHSRRRPHTWLNEVSLFGPLEAWRINLIAERTKRITELLESCRIASQRLQSETGLIYAHLSKTDFLRKELKITDKIGIVHTVDLDKTEFLLQKKATPFDVRSPAALESLAALVRALAEKNVAIVDEHLERNCGFLDGRLVAVDVGSFKELDETL